MATLRIKLKKRKEIVKFQFLYSLHQHMGWPRSNRDIPEEISILQRKNGEKLKYMMLIKLAKGKIVKL